jgi:hypothetical protein
MLVAVLEAVHFDLFLECSKLTTDSDNLLCTFATL